MLPKGTNSRLNKTMRSKALQAVVVKKDSILLAPAGRMFLWIQSFEWTMMAMCRLLNRRICWSSMLTLGFQSARIHQTQRFKRTYLAITSQSLVGRINRSMEDKSHPFFIIERNPIIILVLLLISSKNKKNNHWRSVDIKRGESSFGG